VSEGPEIHNLARRLDRVLRGAELLAIDTRLKKARAWLDEHPGAFDGARFERVEACGKHLVFRLDADRWIHCHLLMFGSWRVHRPTTRLDPDSDVRAELLTTRARLRLVRGQVLDFGIGDPYAQVPSLRTLGPDVLAEPFDAALFRRLLRAPERADQEVAVVLLDQTLANGIGNYLKAEILFRANLDPWRTLGDLTDDEVDRLIEQLVEVPRIALATRGSSVPPETPLPEKDAKRRFRHWVFRRGGHPCYVCGAKIRRARQGPPPGRWTFWCPACQDNARPSTAPDVEIDRTPLALAPADLAVAADDPADAEVLAADRPAEEPVADAVPDPAAGPVFELLADDGDEDEPEAASAPASARG
jgi:endonuclease VIII